MNYQSLNFDETIRTIHDCVARMNELYGRTVFDEWAVISLQHHQARILHYAGPRNDDFLRNFANDLSTLRSELLRGGYQTGDFEFARHAIGTRFEAFMALGDDHYLICNNTQSSMDEIAKDSKWLSAQVPFAELSEKVCALHPVLAV